ncbi:helix-turn-helix transcriptional regulator [Nocardiopsis lucentensis]|uniref:helix-turn-helix transcriptional regulator n=1 Tax=Nocardiopsis lucentensis TaxID=53441 RepID=UPI0006886701|nr:helix-turn-helix transcriptional regulator [Nocardiopsis lucentensis]
MPHGKPVATGVAVAIRELRGHLGWSQSRLADEVCRVSGRDTVTRETVSRWENGKRTPTRYHLRHLAAALQVPLEALETDPVDRRAFLTSIAGTAVAPLVASDLVERGFEAALSGRGPDWDALVDSYGRDYMTAGAAQIQQRLAGDLVVLQRQLDTPHAWATASRLATLFAKTFPGSDGVKAVSWYLRAAEFADRADDREARVWVRGRAAIALGYEGAALDDAERLADQALAIDDRPTLGRLNAIMGKAHASAIRGDADTARELAEEGRRTLDVAASDDSEASDYAVPYWRMNVFLSLLSARLGDERDALAAQEEASRHLPPTLPRFRTHLDMHRGLMLVRAGDRRGGVAHAHAALNQLPPEKHSLTLRMLMDEIEAQ